MSIRGERRGLTISPRLEADRVRVVYGRTNVLRDLSLEIPPERITSLIGANGCGKSTLLSALSRLIKPAQGATLLDGVPVGQIPTRSVSRTLSILTQHAAAPDEMTVGQLCALGRNPHHSFFKGPSTADSESVQEAINMCGLSDLQHRPLNQLSGGQRQRAWIALALAQGTPLMLLDEPTTYLDMAHQVEILELLQSLRDQHRRTIVMVLHDLNQAARYSDHVVAMRDGVICAQGTPKEVISEETILEVFGLRCRVIVNPLDESPLCLPL